MSNAVKYKKQPSTHCNACGTINISKYVYNFLSTNPTTLVLSSLVSDFDKEYKSDFYFYIFFFSGEEGGSGPHLLLQFLLKFCGIII